MDLSALPSLKDAEKAISRSQRSVTEGLDSLSQRLETLGSRLDDRLDDFRPRPARQAGPDPTAGLAMLGGIGVGVALMYFLDPERGPRRRALLLEKVFNLSGTAGARVQSAMGSAASEIGERGQAFVSDARERVEDIAENIRGEKGDESASGDGQWSQDTVPSFEGSYTGESTQSWSPAPSSEPVSGYEGSTESGTAERPIEDTAARLR